MKTPLFLTALCLSVPSLFGEPGLTTQVSASPKNRTVEEAKGSRLDRELAWLMRKLRSTISDKREAAGFESCTVILTLAFGSNGEISQASHRAGTADARRWCSACGGLTREEGLS